MTPQKKTKYQSEGPRDIPSDDEVEEEAPFRLPGVATLRGAFPSLDIVNLTEEFEERASVMKSVPRLLRGPYRTAMRVALEEIREGGRRDDMDTPGTWVEIVPSLAKNVVAQITQRWVDPTSKIAGQI